MSKTGWIVIGVIVAVVAVVTLVWVLRLVFRMVAMRRRLDALGLGGKLVFWGALAYTIFPIDLLPDPIYLDDVGVLTAAMFYLSRLLRKQETLKAGLPHMRRVAEVGARARARRR
jgi:uncharacterized membrane protein YkvA (DUF1232 family)